MPSKFPSPFATTRSSIVSRLMAALWNAMPYILLVGGAMLVAALATCTERRREMLITTAVQYCAEASRLAAAPSLDGIREGMVGGDDTDGLVYKAATAGFTALCEKSVQQRLDGAPEE